MRVRWVALLMVPALVAAACSTPKVELDGVGAVDSPFAEDLNARVEVTIDVLGDGSVSRDNNDVRPGRPVRLEALPALGSQFVAWSGEASGTDPKTEIRPETDVTVTATFEPIPPLGEVFTILVDGEGWVSRRSGEVIEGEIFLRAIPASGWAFTGWTGMVENSTNPVALPTREANEITAHFELVGGDAPVITVWGGDEQRHELGVPQRWINVAGNVIDPQGIQSLTYTVNGVEGEPLRLGPDGRRLQDLGDFNIELDTETLELGATEVIITAVDGGGVTATALVDVHFTGSEWALPYETNWAAAGAVEDQAQVIDGIWSVGTDGVRPEQIGYDRLIAIGDQEWENYEARFSLKIHDDDPRGYDLTSEPFVGIILRWPGHSYDAEIVAQPRWYYWPAGSLSGYYLNLDGTSKVKVETNESINQSEESAVLDFGVTYEVRARVQSGTNGVNHRLRIWPKGEDEPLSWDVDVTADTQDAGPDGGSLLLIAHYFDVTFGDVRVEPL